MPGLFETVKAALVGRRAGHEARSWDPFIQAVRSQGISSATGEPVTESSALSIAAVYSCVRVLGESMASLPLALYRRDPVTNGRERIYDHPVAKLLSRRPNPNMTAFEWRELITGHLNLRGNAYVRIQRNGQYHIQALWPMHPDQVQVQLQGGALAYSYGGLTFKADDILHFKGLSRDGLTGLDPLSLERETFGHYIAAQQYGANSLRNDATPPGVLVHPGALSKEARKRVNESWSAAHGGANQGTIAILEEGMEFKPISITPQNAQFIETLKLKRTDIAGIYRVPPHMIGDLEKATFSNIEHQDLGFAKHTLVPWCERIETVLDDGLLTEEERDQGYFLEHNLNGIMRGDLKSRVESYTMLWDRGIFNADDILALENHNPQPDGLGQKYYVPMNFVEAGKEPPAPEPPADPPPPEEPDQDPPAEPDEQKAASPRQENRIQLKRALERSRLGIQRGSKATIEDAMRRSVRRDVQSVTAALKKKSGGELAEWLEEYFSDTAYTRKQIQPVLEALAEALGSSMAIEVDQEWSFGPALRAWVESYIETFAEFHQGSAKVQLKKLLAESDQDTRDELILGRLEEWENGSDTRVSRAAAIAGHESTRFGGAFAVAFLAGAGVASLVWRNTGDSSCPWCQAMDGQVVGVGQPFVRAGEELTNGEETLTPSNDVVHPPIHGGCDCIVAPE